MNYLIELVKEFDLNPMDVNFKALELAINELSERESKVIEMRYRDRLTLEEVGKHFGVTRERIRQLEQRALRRLKHNRTTFMSVSYAEYKELEKAYRLLVSKIGSKLDGLEEMPIKEAEETSILDLGFSLRTTNCLFRSGIKTLGQLSNVPYDSLIHIRGLGRKSLNEIITKLQSLGY